MGMKITAEKEDGLIRCMAPLPAGRHMAAMSMGGNKWRRYHASPYSPQFLQLVYEMMRDF